MKKIIINVTIAASVALALCTSTIHANAAAPEGYKTHDLVGFTVSLPAEFEKSDGWSTDTNKSFNSNAVNVRDDGDEYLSSATINVFETDVELGDLNEYAENMTWSIKAMEETVVETTVEDNTMIMRTTSEIDNGHVVYWHFLVIGGNGKAAGGTISYYEGDAKFYDSIVNPIIQSIKFK